MKNLKLLLLMLIGLLLLASCSENEDVVSESPIKLFKSRLDKASSEAEVLAISQEYANSNIEIVNELASVEEVQEILGRIEGDYFNEKETLKTIYCDSIVDNTSYKARYCAGKCNSTMAWLDVNMSGSVSATDLVVMVRILNGQSVPSWQVIRAKYPNDILAGCESANGFNFTCTDREAVATWLLGYHTCTS